MRRVGASFSGLVRAASFASRAISWVGPPRISFVPGAGGRKPQDSCASSATFSSSGFVSYLLRFGSIIKFPYEGRADSVSGIRVRNYFKFDRFPAALTLGNAKRPQARVFVAESNNKVNRRWIVGKPNVGRGWFWIFRARV